MWCGAISRSRPPSTSCAPPSSGSASNPGTSPGQAEAAEEGIDLPRDAGAREAWLAALAAHPRALQRPIITATDGTTVVGRDPDSLAAVIAAES